MYLLLLLLCARQDKRFPRHKIRAQLTIRCKQMASVDGKMTDRVSISMDGFSYQRYPREEISYMGSEISEETLTNSLSLL